MTLVDLAAAEGSSDGAETQPEGGARQCVRPAHGGFPGGSSIDTGWKTGRGCSRSHSAVIAEVTSVWLSVRAIASLHAPKMGASIRRIQTPISYLSAPACATFL